MSKHHDPKPKPETDEKKATAKDKLTDPRDDQAAGVVSDPRDLPGPVAGIHTEAEKAEFDAHPSDRERQDKRHVAEPGGRIAQPMDGVDPDSGQRTDGDDPEDAKVIPAHQGHHHKDKDKDKPKDKGK